MYENEAYFRMAIRLRKETGKSMRCCYFCVRYNRGNYAKALAFCTGKKDAEDGRCI